MEFPGFSIELPFGRVQKTTHLPAAGAHQLVLLPSWMQSLPPSLRDLVQANDGSLSVHWRAGAMTPEEQREFSDALVKSTTRALGVPSPQITEANGRWTARIPVGKRWVMTGGAYCSPGLSVYVTFAPSEPSAADEQYAQHAMQSVVCKMGANIPPLPVLALDLSSDYRHVETPDKSADNYESTQGRFLSVSPTDGDIVNAKSAVPILNNLFGILMHAPGSAIDLQRESVARTDGEPAAVFEARGSTGLPEGSALIVGVVYCQELDLSYFLVMAGEGVSKSDTRRLTTTAKCPK